ncbi:hypothetical protein BIFDEN_00960 [Bifidobacterium dentium ATCC 27678]|nr:hypothetical protein BIFDEN_00960 [Bifidobacterium dentium ATCC 27678]
MHDSSQPTLSANRAWPDPSTLHCAHATADVDTRPHPCALIGGMRIPPGDP